MPTLSVIIPAYNERANLTELFDRLAAVLSEIDYEILVVDDDSPDGTASLARSIAQQNARVRTLQRVGRTGLSSAVVEGMLATSSPYIAVMDADMQHDEAILPEMLNTLKRDNLDLVIGSRNISGGSMGEFASHRVALSQLGRRLSRAVCRAELSDPMSGYFMVTRAYLQEVVHSLSCIGFKILVDLVASSRRPVRFAEVAYTFRNRHHGESKLDVVVGLEFLELLLDKMIRGWIPVSYLIFSMVGALGLVLNVVIVYVFLRLGSASFEVSQAAAALVVIALNFFINNRLTFRSTRLRGVRMWHGLLLFYLACSVGLVFNLAAAHGFRSFGLAWYFASFAGTVVGSVWNYLMTSLFVWRIRRRRQARLQVTREAAYQAAPIATFDR